MKTVKGDLLKLARQGDFDLIAHGCNCMCTMGAGIAKYIKQAYPAAYVADCATKKGAREKLGTCSFARVSSSHGELVVVNAYTQFNWRGKGVLADYDAIRGCMVWIASHFPDSRIGMPFIGAGLAGGDWAKISTIIEEELAAMDVTLVAYSR